MYCTACGDACTAVTEDHGIGSYEYWGATGYDSRIETLSNCCDAEITDEPLPVEPDPNLIPESLVR